MISNRLEYHIDSKLKMSNSVSDSDFFYQILIPQYLFKKINKVSCEYSTIPKSSYIIEGVYNRNKFIIWKEGVGNIEIELTEGNYRNTHIYGDTYDLKKHLKIKLDNATGDIWTISKYLHPDTETGKLLYFCNDATNKKFIFSNYENNLSEVLGFGNIAETDIFTDSIISTSIINLNKNNMCYIVSDICITENTDTILKGQSVLDCIYLNNQQLLSYNTNTQSILEDMKTFNHKTASIFHFKLYNENGENMILNGITVAFTIVLFTYTPYENLFKKISNFIDYFLIKFY